VKGARKLALVAAQAAILALALLAPATAPAASGNGGVLVVGDSLELLTIPYLERHLPGVRLTTNAVGGYNSNQIFALFEQSYDPSHSVIVFDAGTNDNPAYPEILAGNLNAVAERVGDRCMVVPSVYGFTVNGVDNTGKNAVVRSFAASRPGTQVPDWYRVAATRKELMQSDDLHPTAAGADHRARLIADGIKACLGFAQASGGGEAAVEPAPELPPARKFARRQAAMSAAIATSLGAAVAMRLAADRPLLGAALAMVSAYA
jgi:hypothetical protein